MSKSPVELEPENGDSGRFLGIAVLFAVIFASMQLFQTPSQNNDADPSATPSAAPVADGNSAAATNPATNSQATATNAAGNPTVGASVPAANITEVKYTASADVAGSDGKAAVSGGYRATATNKGAQLESFLLTGYQNHHQIDADGKAALMNMADGQRGPLRMLSLNSIQTATRTGDVQLPADAMYEVRNQDSSSVTYELVTAQNVRITRKYTFDQTAFQIKHELVVKNEDTNAHTFVYDMNLVGAPVHGGGGSMMSTATPDQLIASCRSVEDRETFDVVQDHDDPIRVAGPMKYIALDRHYFLAAIAPQDPSTASGCRAEVFKENVTEGEAFGTVLTLENTAMALAAGESKTVSHTVFMGPKQMQLLSKAGADLDENVDFGWLGLISRPLLWLLVQLKHVTGNYGIAIILLTLVIKIVTYPLTKKSYISSQEMKIFQPKLKELQAKYGNDQVVLGQKMQEFYKEHNFSPMAGCLPMLVQMPIWMALYRTLWGSVELYQQPFYGWVIDLTQPERLPFLPIPILPLIVGALMLAQTASQPPPPDQPQMKYMMWGMPIFFTFLMLNMASGLSIYMITNSIVGIFQQMYLKKKYTKEV